MKSINSLLNDAKAQKKPLYLIIAEKDCFENGTDLKSLDLQFSNLSSIPLPKNQKADFRAEMRKR